MNGITVVCYQRNDERYFFIFDEDHRTDTLRQLGRFAVNPELDFSWYDAAIVSNKMREVQDAGVCCGR